LSVGAPGVRRVALRADDEPSAACNGLLQAHRHPRHHAQAEGAVEEFKKTFPARLEEIAQEQGIEAREIEVWFGDEARVGQKNKITRRWAKRGSRPSAPKDQRTASAYMFGAICPEGGQGRGACAATLRYAGHEPAPGQNSLSTFAPGAHAALLFDQAVWHLAGALNVPPNITIVLLPSKYPELNPQENVWQFRRDNWLSNRVFTS
jgi:DDE superfamily endonuclease